MSSAVITQLIATGSIEAYLTQDAQFTFFKTRYSKHTMFALESITQPFGTSVAFGSESQVTLNRCGDLLYYLYLQIDLPGIAACDAQKEACFGMPSGIQFPMYMESSCTPCARNDEAAIADYIEDGFTEADEEGKQQKLKAAKDRWLRDKYGEGPSLGCCEQDIDDCPDQICPELTNFAYYTNDIGHFLVKSAKLVIGGSCIDQVWSDLLFIWEELSGRSGRKLCEMTGKRWTRQQLICDSRQKRTLWVPLPFFFTQSSGSALSLASLQFHGVSLHVEWARLEHAIVVSSPNVAVKNTATGCCLTPNDLKAQVDVTYVFLENSEREKFSSTSFEQLVIQHQCFTQQSNNSSLRLNLSFNHPCLEIMFAVRRQCQERVNNWFCYSGIDNRDPVVSAQIMLNNQPRFSARPGSYFRLVQPYQHHTCVPDTFCYTYSFALHPEDVHPSGQINMSRIDNCELKLQLQDGLGREQVTVLCFARSWNILRFKEGLAGIGFAN